MIFIVRLKLGKSFALPKDDGKTWDYGDSFCPEDLLPEIIICPQ